MSDPVTKQPSVATVCVGLTVFGAGFAFRHPVVGAALAVAGTAGYLAERIFFPRTRAYRRALANARQTAANASQRVDELERVLGDLRDRLVRVENRGRV